MIQVIPSEKASAGHGAKTSATTSTNPATATTFKGRRRLQHHRCLQVCSRTWTGGLTAGHVAGSVLALSGSGQRVLPYPQFDGCEGRALSNIAVFGTKQTSG